ncbi:hypothetical protein [Pseudactinotalea terrae]|uniref:hypothetical protein n=1 Tax=Pseudactinotalea terrae TaxID=1743262 RepID=UPI0012E2D119|nr:hypothetical protein [Pseudactinotalea terrae]
MTTTASPTAARRDPDKPARATRTRRTLRWAGALGAALVWVSVMTTAQLAGAPLWVVYLLLTVPALICMLALRGGWPLTRRWLVVLVLALVVDQSLLSAYLLVALTWALHRTWVTDRAPLRFSKEPTRDR